MTTIITQEEQLKNLRQQENNNFPVTVFHPAIQEIINNAQTKHRFAPDWTATSLLYAASAAIGRALEIQHSPDWHEGPTLYACLIGAPGTGKTHPLTKALKPLNDHDNGAYQLYQQELKDYKRTIQNWKKLPPDQRETEPDKPIWNHTIVSDFTQEALIKVHSENPRSTAVHVDEFKGFFKNFTRYNTGGVQEFFLSNWSRQAIQTDRKGSDPIKIDTPSIGVAGTIQPGILDSLADEDRSENGFLHRFLFAWPEVQALPWDTTPPDGSIFFQWHIIVKRLLELPLYNGGPKVLTYTPEARTMLFNWQRANTEKINNETSEYLRGIWSKLEVYIQHLALILQALDYTKTGKPLSTVESTAMAGAIQLVHYYEQMAIKVYQRLGTSSPLDKLSTLEHTVYDALPEESFTTAQGILIATQYDMPQRTFERWIKKTTLFNKPKRGHYEKLQ